MTKEFYEGLTEIIRPMLWAQCLFTALSLLRRLLESYEFLGYEMMDSFMIWTMPIRAFAVILLFDALRNFWNDLASPLE